ncbi:PREDICTED: uncharacterized protein LOC109580157 [Amphimedon queenslandica]|uniref:Death domain-containing protein n=1 Tax=Amphimedon queenslandica TaxID=400682 RepID=A0AAN0JQE8_AMPQE|nr:PREDICTED: uncharacterized protein LOC109580157 [Amphimedon queenslandica]|eukprot:XP_019859044.1 PREDICTED: uncharacterized protein LOC109580157 [Amphimedon queenslandica]
MAKESASDQFRRISARLAGSISPCLTTVSMYLNARRLIAQELHDEMINGHDIDAKKAAKLVNAIQTTLDSHTDPEAYLNDVCSALKDVGEKQITDIVNELERDIVPPTASAKPISTEDLDTPAADRIPDTQNPLTEDAVHEWLKESTVELTIKRVQMHGLPGSGKMYSQRLLLNEDPPKEDNTTPIACRAVKATRISSHDGRMEIVDAKALLSRLAHNLKEAAAKQKEPSLEDHDAKSKEYSSKTNPTDIDEKLQQNHRINGVSFIQGDPFSYTNIQFLKDVLSSGSILQPYLAPGSEENTSPGSATPQFPQYFVLGTHKDKAKQEVIEQYNKELSLLTSGSEKKGYRIIPAIENGDIIYAVNTMLEPGPEREAEAKRLCKMIHKKVSEDKIRIPIRWFAFELTLLGEAKGRSFLQMGDVLSAGRSLQMTKIDTMKALQYLHNVTIILYYPQVLPDFVFVDPHPILDILSRLLALATCQIPRKIVKQGVRLSEFEMNHLTKNGFFTQALLAKLEVDVDFPKSDFIKLLLHFHIIIETDEQGKYFIPSALPPCPKTRQRPESDIDPLQIIWPSPVMEQEENPRVILPVPCGIFPLAIVNLMKRTEQPKFCFPNTSSQCLRYRDAMSFRVHHQKNYIGTIHIIKKHECVKERQIEHKHIEIYFEGDTLKYCPLICEAVKEAIASSCEALHIKPDGYEFAFACPSTEGCYRIVTNENEMKVQCTLKCPMPPIITGKEKYWSWFSQKSLTEGTVATATVTNEIDIKKIEKWLKEGEVKLEITRINMHGAPGAGKTCSQHLLLNEPPPEKLTDSTPIACRAVQATRISIDHDKNKKWERVEIKDLLNKLAFHFEKKKKDEEISTKAPNHSTEQSLEKPTENEPAPTENEPAPTENEAAPTKNEAAPTENETAPTENELVPTENEAAPTKNEAAPTENEAAPTENEPVPTENEAAPTENEQLENDEAIDKPTENAESIKIKLADTEVIKKIADAIATGKFQEFSTNWVYFIDSGGQPAYRELLPLFARGAALNIITIDLTKGLDEKCEFQYRIDQHTLSIDIKLQYSNLDIIQSTISSGAMLNPIEIPYVSVSESDESKHSHYLILGTHIDKLKEKGTLDNMNKKLINEGFNNLIKQNEDGGSVIFPVNTLLPAESKERKEASVKLCTAVSNCRVAMTIKLPIRLFTFEISLQLEAKKKNQSFLTKEEVMELGKPLKLIESDINKALEFLHNVTIILYYPDVLPNIIFVDPEPILDILSRLIAIRYVDHNNRQFIANPPPSPAITWDLVKYGLFKEDLLKIIGKQKIFNSDFESFHMIDLLKHLHIIAEVKEKKNSCHMIKFLLLRLLQIVTGNKKEKKNKYFFPCALPSCGKLNDPPTEIQPLLIAWEIGDSNETTLAIPQGLFTLTIVHLLERKDEVEFSPLKLNPCYRYNNAMSLCVYKKYHIDIINCYTHLEIRVRGRCRDICPKIREIVSKAVKESSKDLKLKKDNKFVFAFKCPLQKTCIVQKDNCSTLCPCEDQCEVLKGDDDSYRCWFSDYQIQSSSSDTVQVPTPPHDALPNEGSCSKEVQNYQSNYIKNPAKNWGCYMFVIFLAVGVVLAGVAMNRFVTVEKNTNNIEKFLTIMTHIATGTLPTQPHQYSTTVNPDNDGVGQLGIEDLDKVLTVLQEAMFGSAEWNNLGLKLGLLEPTTLDVIEDGGGDAHKKLKKTIGAWLRGEDKVTSRTWQTLIDAVKGTGDRAAAERIPDKLK